MRDILLTIMDGYLAAKTEPMASHALAVFIRNEGPAAMGSQAAISPRYTIRGSAGLGSWAEIPWIAVFDPDVTRGAERGYYVAYLFRSDMSAVYLSLCMGSTFLQVRYRRTADRWKVMEAAVRACRSVLGPPRPGFSYEPIDLHATTGRRKGYELSHICGRPYLREEMPDDAHLVDDLRSMLGVYRDLKRLLGGSDIATLLDAGAADTLPA